MATGRGASIQQQSKEGETKSTSLAEATCCLLHRFEMLIVTYNWNGLKKKKWLVRKQNKIKKNKDKASCTSGRARTCGSRHRSNGSYSRLPHLSYSSYQLGSG